jgi:hypothetical protein
VVSSNEGGRRQVDKRVAHARHPPHRHVDALELELPGAGGKGDKLVWKLVDVLQLPSVQVGATDEGDPH